MSYCPQCGTGLPQEAVFCCRCGCKVPAFSEGLSQEAKILAAPQRPDRKTQVLNVLLGLFALSQLSRIGSVELSQAWIGDGSIRRVTDPANGIHLAQAIFALGLLLLRLRPGRFLGILARIPGKLAAACCLALLIVLAKTTYHLDFEAAGAMFASAQESKRDITNSGDLLFAEDAAGRRHVARISPDLVRAIQRRDVSVNVVWEREHDCVAPGWTPIAVLLLLALAPRLRGAGARGKGLPWTFLAFAVVNLYVITWFSSAQVGFVTSEFRANPLWLGAASVLLALGYAFFALAFSRTEGTEESSEKACATSLFFAIPAAILGGIFVVSFRSPGNPSIIWLLAYCAAVCGLWKSCVVDVAARAER